MIEKLALPFDLLSDPEGDVGIKPFGFWKAIVETQKLRQGGVTAVTDKGRPGL